MQRTTQFRLLAVGGLATVALGGGLAFAALTPGTSQEAAEQPTPSPTSTPSPEATPEDSSAKPAEAAPSEDEDPQDAREALALEAAETMTTWNPQQDHSQTAAELRAADMVADSISEVLEEPENPTYSPEWREAADRGAVSVSEAELREVTEDRYYDVEVTWSWEADGHRPIHEGPRYFSFIIDDDDDGDPIIVHYEWNDGR